MYSTLNDHQPNTKSEKERKVIITQDKKKIKANQRSRNAAKKQKQFFRNDMEVNMGKNINWGKENTIAADHVPQNQ